MVVIVLIIFCKPVDTNDSDKLQKPSVGSNGVSTGKYGKFISDSPAKKKNAAVGKPSKSDKKPALTGPRKILGAGKSAEELSKEFASMDDDAKINMITNLEKFEPDLLALAFSDKSPDVRLAAAQSLSWFDTDQKNILPFIATAMKDGTSDVRDESYSLMDSLDDNYDVLSLLGPALSSQFSDVRLNAVSKFIDLEIPKEEFKELVVKALSDKDDEVREEALQSASFLWDQDFDSEDEAVRYITKH